MCSYLHSGEIQNPVHLRLGPQQLYIIQGAENIRSVWRSSLLSTNSNFYYALRFFFGMSEKSGKRYLADDSGPAIKPYPTSQVAPHNRVVSINHQLFNNFLVGSGFAPLCTRFEKELVSFRSGILSTHEWTRKPDLMQLFTSDLTKASLRAICGPTFLDLDPDFPRRFWEYSNGLPFFMRRIPKWLAPRSHGTRRSLVQSVKRWHQVAKQEFTPESIDADGDGDPFWGCAFFRSRHERLSKVDDYDEDALACEDFAAIWGSAKRI
jgi:hypothetical protein